MPLVGFHCSHEQIGPAQLLRDLQHAEDAGFAAAMCSDHINPWSSRQGHSGNIWAWLGAALATTSLRIGTVTAPGQRYHPAVLAQAAATLASMFPERLWLALGSGEHINESITGEPWPPKEKRQQRLEECADVMRRLMAGEEVTHDGLITLQRARVWDAPAQPPPFLIPVLGPATAERAATWADGLITVNQPAEALREIIDTYRGAGGRGRIAVQVHLSWAPTQEEAMAIARDQWRNNVFAPPVASDLPTVDHFEVLGQNADDEALQRSVLVSSDTAQHVRWLREIAATGVDELYLHHVGQEQGAFIDTFASEVLGEVA